MLPPLQTSIDQPEWKILHDHKPTISLRLKRNDFQRVSKRDDECSKSLISSNLPTSISKTFVLKKNSFDYKPIKEKDIIKSSRLASNPDLHISAMFTSTSLQRQHLPLHKRKLRSRRHTLSGIQGPLLHSANYESEKYPNDGNEESAREHTSVYHPSRDGAISPSEAESKRLVFLKYLESRYPQHADTISGKVKNHCPALSSSRTRASYSADNSQCNTGLTSSSNESELPRYGSLSRGSRLRSSLPIIRTRSRSRELPLGVIYLEYSGEKRTAILPNEITSLDTIRALFVQAYPGLITMPMMDPQRHSILLKNKKTGNYDEIDNVGNIKDRSIVRTRPTGIPTPGSKKSGSYTKAKTLGLQNNQGSNSKVQQKSVEDFSIVEKNYKNLSQHKSGLKAPVKPGIRQYQSPTTLIKSSSPKANGFSHDAKVGSRLPQKTCDASYKTGKYKAPPPPPPRSAKPTVTLSSTKLEYISAATSSSNDSLRIGNGLGGGSVPHTEFSYVGNGRGNTGSPMVTLSTSSMHKVSKGSSISYLSPTCMETSNQLLPQTLPKPSTNSKKIKEPDTISLSSDLSQMKNASEKNTLPKKSLSLQHRQHSGSMMASHTTFSANVSPSSVAGDKATQSPTLSLRQSNHSLNGSITALNETFHQLSLPDLNYRHSSIKRSASPERRATINGSGGFAVYCKGGRSFKGQQLKPVCIPRVPDFSSTSDSIQDYNGPNLQGDAEDAFRNEKQNMSHYDSHYSSSNLEENMSSPVQHVSPVIGESLKTNKKKFNENKKGLFGLRKLMSNKSNKAPDRTLESEQSTHKDNARSNIHFIPNTSNLASESMTTKSSASPWLRQLFASSESCPLTMTSKFSDTMQQSSPLSQRKTGVQINQLSHSLFSTQFNEEEKNQKTPDEVGASVGIAINPSISDDDKDSVAEFTNLQASINPGIAGVLKGSNLVKSESSDSILSDSGASNISATPSLKTKKVSFQDDVTVCYANGICTFSHGLRQSDAEENVKMTFNQSLSIDAGEQDQNQTEEEIVQYWRDEEVGCNANSHINVRHKTSAEINMLEQHDRLAHDYSSNRSKWRLVNNNLSHFDYQSAVAAAIESISNNPATASNTNIRQQESAVPISLLQTAERYEQFSVSSSPVSLAICDYSNNTRISSQPQVLPRQINEAIIETKKLDCPQYFQTQKPSMEFLRSSERFKSETPPYYECCESVQPFTPGQLNAALDSKAKAGSRLDVALTDVASNSHDGNKENSRTREEGFMQSNADNEKTAETIPVDLQAIMPQKEMREKILKIKTTANNLKEQLHDLKRQQRLNMERMNELVNEKTSDLTQFICNTAGAQHQPLRMRRMRLDQERYAYGVNASGTEQQLYDVEEAVEELRNAVVERRCRVNAREVEALVLQLSQAGRTVARLKSAFPTLCDEIRSVGAGENEVMLAEATFVESEPAHLDEQLKRCKQLTATLFTLKKLATVQEARSRTPTTFAQIRPNAPSQGITRGAWEDPKINNEKVLADVNRIKVDHSRRMESIQEAEISWTRRRKYIREHDSKKFEKALELAEKALNKTDYITYIEQKRQTHLVQLYNKRDASDRVPDTNLTTSESSSLESLPPPPVEQHLDRVGLRQISGHSRFSQPVKPPPTSHLPPQYSTIDQHLLLTHDNEYLSANFSSEFGRTTISYNNTGSLPRQYVSSRYQGYNVTPVPERRIPTEKFSDHQWLQAPSQQIERSQSVTPQRWNISRMTPIHFKSNFAEPHEMTEQERRRLLEEQAVHMEKNQRLKEQYSKLQQLQKQQRQARRNSPKQRAPPPVYQTMASSFAAKSSDV